jgi:hypothetical protein
MNIKLPRAVMDLYKSHKTLRRHFASTGLAFTLDGKLVGDIAEALTAEAFGLQLCTKRTPGIDAHTRGGRSVQIKSTGKPKAGPAFTRGEATADHLIFLRFRFDEGIAEIVYNGPEAPVRAMLPEEITGTKRASLPRVLEAAAAVPHRAKLRRVG